MNRGNWYIYPIDKITPSGRIVCGGYTLNPDLRVRGPDKWGPWRAYEVTEGREKAARRREYLEIIKKAKFEELPDEILAAVAEVLDGSRGKHEEFRQLNSERVALIYKLLETKLSDSETARLNELNRLTEEYLDQHFPLDFSVIDKELGDSRNYSQRDQ